MEQVCDGDLLSGLPLDCLAIVLSFTSPRDVCRLATLSSSLRHLAFSDSVWKLFLPSDLPVPSSFSSHSSSKMQLFFTLCVSPLFFDRDRKCLWMDKVTGKKCYMLGARDLNITWGDTPQYWAWSHCPDSRFGETAELVCVCWLEMRAKMKTDVLLCAGTRYSAYFVFKLKEYSSGFGTCRVRLAVGVGPARRVFLEPQHRGRGRRARGESEQQQEEGEEDESEVGAVVERRGDGWLEVEMGEMDDHSNEVEMSLLEVDQGHWKSGLVVYGIEIRPKSPLSIN